MSKPNFHIRKGDEVQVISGAHKGAQGSVIQIIPSKSQALVEGVRLITKATRKSQKDTQGGLIKREGPIHISNLKVVAAKKEEKEKKTTKKAAKKK